MNPIGLIITLSLLLVSVSVHEFAHGWVAYKLGDNTAKYSGRLTLNPLAHIDPIGTIILPLFLFFTTQGRFVFGAAKPVPINFNQLKNPKRDIIFVGASGPIANFIFAFILSLLWRILPVNQAIDLVFLLLININVVLGVFNLIPIPPLDGSRILSGLLPDKLSYEYSRLEPYGFMIIIILIFLGLFNAVVEPITKIIMSLLVINS